MRKFNFIQNHKYIANSNKLAIQNGQSLRLAVYHHADMDTDEFIETYTGLHANTNFNKFISNPISYVTNEISSIVEKYQSENMSSPI